MNNIIKASASDLLKSLQKEDQDKLDALQNTINKHALIAVGAAFVPVPFLDLGIAVVNIWHMYGNTNN